MSAIHEPTHPLWATIRFVVLVVATSVILWLNASHFDETEIRTIVEIAIVAGGYETLGSWLNRDKKKNNEESG